MRVGRNVGRWLIPISAFGLLIGALTAATPTGAAPPTPPALQPLHLLQPRQGNVSNDPAGRYGESHAAVNPTNPNNIVATYNQDRFTRSCVANHDPYCDIVTAQLAGGGGLSFPEPKPDFASLGGPPKAFNCGTFVTFDRGQTWQHVDPPGWPLDHPELKDQGDCTVAVGPDGSFYVSFDDLNWNDPSFALPTCGIGITKSNDGGLSWGNVVLTGTACDGPKTVVDPNDGRVYETSGGALGSRSTANPNDPFVFPNSPNDQYVAVSSDGVTWAIPHGLGGQDGATYRNASGRITAANGTVAVSFRSTSATACNFFVGTGAPCLVFQDSTDGGATWSRHAVTNGATTILSTVMTAADPSTPGHYTVAGLNASQQFVAFQTSNSGQTWTTAGAPVTDSTSLTKGHTWMNYSSTGVLGLMWKSNQPGGGFKVYAGFSGNGGTAWMGSGAIEVSNGTSPTAPTAQYGPFIGVSDDYSHIAMGPDVAQVTWADWRPGDRQGFVSAVRFLNYDFGGFLPPIAKRGTVNSGAIVPVKFQLSVKGQNVSWATGTVTVDGNPATSAGGGDNTFRYDPASQQYIFNWDTSGLGAGDHTLAVHLDDDATQSVTVTVK